VRGEARHVEGKFIRQTGGSGQYGVVYIDLEPAPGEGFDFVNKIKGGSVGPAEFIPAVEKGCEEALESGVKAGYPMVDIRVHAGRRQVPRHDSSEIAFRSRARSHSRRQRAAPAGVARADLRRRGRHARGFPSVEVIGDLSPPARSNRGAERRGNALTVTARVPLAEMFGYATDLRVPTPRVERTTSMQFEAYEEVPPNIAGEGCREPRRRVEGGLAVGTPRTVRYF